MLRQSVVCLSLILLAACGGGGGESDAGSNTSSGSSSGGTSSSSGSSSGGGTSSSSGGTACNLALPMSCSLSGSSSSGGACTTTSSTADIATQWVLNTTEQAPIIGSLSGGILVNVQSVSVCDNAVTVEATGIPDYEFNISQAQIDWLNARPRASTDFVNTSQTSASAGNVIRFGEDINYRSDTMSTQCSAGEGYGYWPPGPVCPTNQNKNSDFPISPTQNSGTCATGGGPIGYAINGVSIYNWTDGQSYDGNGDHKGDGVWETIAPFAEVYDVDLCGGHAAQGDYHHHFYSECWAKVAGEDTTAGRSGHSVIFGFAADGYPVYGPWHDTGVLAQSCWKMRDYNVGPTDVGYGCVGFNGAAAGERNCVLVDPYDPSQGVVAATPGPTTSGTYTSLSGNTFSTVDGFFYEDYYFDSACPSQGAQYLDAYNGHDHDGLGYHYHLTVTDTSSALTDNFPYALKPVFPFTFGPRFRGNLPSSNGVTNCGGLGGGGGGGPPPP